MNSEPREDKVRERIPHIDFMPKEIPLNLGLDMVPSSFADVTRALRRYFRGGFVYVSFRFKAKENSNGMGMSSLIC